MCSPVTHVFSASSPQGQKILSFQLQRHNIKFVVVHLFRAQKAPLNVQVQISSHLTCCASLADASFHSLLARMPFLSSQHLLDRAATQSMLQQSPQPRLLCLSTGKFSVGACKEYLSVTHTVSNIQNH